MGKCHKMCIYRQAMSGPESGPGPGASEGNQHCPTCSDGLDPTSQLRRLQVNDNECVAICLNEKCLSNPSSSSIILRRKSSEIPNLRRRRQKQSAPAQEILAPPCFDPILLWKNKESLCWLDASLFVMVFCRSLRRCLNVSSMENDSLKTLCHEFDNAQVTFQASNSSRTNGLGGGHMLASSYGHLEPRPAFKGGMESRLSFVSNSDQSTSYTDNCSEDCEHNTHGAHRLSGSTHRVAEISTFDESSELMQFLDEDTSLVDTETIRETGTCAVGTYSTPYRVGGNNSNEDVPSGQGSSFQVDEPLAILDAVRERLWGEVQPRLQCQRGAEDSPVFALPVILRKNRSLEAHFRTTYHWQFFCSHCGYVEVTPCKGVMPSLKTLSKTLNVTTYLSHRPCSSCHAPAQRNQLYIRSLPPCPMFHFVEGLPKLNSWSQLDFNHAGHEYRVAALIQYKQNPNHFVGWVKDTERNLWLQGDDLKGPIVHWSQEPPAFPSSQCHVVMWERQAECTDCSSLQSLVRGILEAEQLNLAPPQVPQDPERGVQWSGDTPDDSLSSPPLEAYIPKVVRGPSPADASKVAESGCANADKGTSDTSTQDLTPSIITGTRVTEQSNEQVTGSLNAEPVNKGRLDAQSGMLQSAGNETITVFDGGEKPDRIASSVLPSAMPELSTKCQDSAPDADLENGTRLGDVSGLQRSDSDASAASSIASPSSLLYSIERSSAEIASTLNSLPAFDEQPEMRDSGDGRREPTNLRAMDHHHSELGGSSNKPSELSTNSTEEPDSSLRPPSPSTFSGKGQHSMSVDKKNEPQGESAKNSGSVNLRRRKLPQVSRKDAVVPCSSAAVTSAPSPTASVNAKERTNDYRNYKKKLSILSRVMEWSVNEVQGPLRRDLEKRARLGRLAAAQGKAQGKVNPAGVADIERLYTGRSDPDRILRSIPRQLDAVPTNGRRNSLETWRACRGKPLHFTQRRSSANSLHRTPSTDEPQRANPRKSETQATRVSGLAARFATFKRSLPTFSQYKETVEAARQVGNLGPLTRSQRAGSISPIGSPSGSSESSDNSRTAMMSFQEEFMDITPIASPTQLLPDLEKFFEGL